MTRSQLEVCDVTKRYGRVRALAGISVTLQSGSVCTLLGPNGAGKSTLLGIISTLVRPSSGTIVFRADGASQDSDDTLRRSIGVVAHDSLVYRELTGIENLMFYGKLYEIDDVDKRVEEILEQVGLEPHAYRRRAYTYSRGMMQRLSLARALLHDPKVLLFDEPFTGLDQSGTVALTNVVADTRARGCIIIAATHNLEAIAGVTDHVLVLRSGKVVCDQRSSEVSQATETGFSYEQLKELYHQHTA